MLRILGCTIENVIGRSSRDILQGIELDDSHPDNDGKRSSDDHSNVYLLDIADASGFHHTGSALSNKFHAVGDAALPSSGCAQDKPMFGVAVVVCCMLTSCLQVCDPDPKPNRTREQRLANDLHHCHCPEARKRVCALRGGVHLVRLRHTSPSLSLLLEGFLFRSL